MSQNTHSVRSGFVLLAMLGVVIAAGAIAMVAMRTTRLVLLTGANRVDLVRARWSAYGCLERARAAFVESQVSPVTEGFEWVRLDTVLSSSPLLDDASGCALDAHPAGDRLNVNSSPAEALRSLFSVAGVRPLQVDSLVDALLDWRDHDDQPRRLGAEALWYASQHRPAPRNGPLGSSNELALVRGFAGLASVVALLDVEPGRPSLTRAPPAILSTLPGFSAEVVAWLVDRRKQGPLGADLSQSLGTLSDTSRRAVLAAQGQLQGHLVLEPDAWILRSRARTRASSAVAVVEATIGREGGSTVVLRLREWWE